MKKSPLRTICTWRPQLGKRRHVLRACYVLACVLMAPVSGHATEDAARPNIIIIVADDLGYSDLGVMGSEIATPNLDKLARDGRLFTNFHTAPSCSPTRSMLLTGTDSHVAGLGAMAEFLPPEIAGKPGYEGHLSNRVVTVATLLQDSGYHTYMTGKWHLGHAPEHLPNRHGFEQSFALLQGGASHYDNKGIFETDPVAQYRENGKPAALPDDFYSSTFFTDRMIAYMEKNKASGKPFFSYLAYTAPHWPLQAPASYLRKYRGKYDGGYGPIYRARIARLEQAGIIPPNLPTETELAFAPGWANLPDAERRREARRMETYAAMIEAMDHEIGRLLAYLGTVGKLDNTIILFMSDNGPDGFRPEHINAGQDWVRRTFDNSFENMGRAGSFIGTGPQWAHVSAAPFSMFKAFTYEGGTRVPLIVWSGRGLPKAGHDRQFLSVLDLMPTILEAARVPYSATSGRQTLLGVSIFPALADRRSSVHKPDYAMGIELHGRRSLIQWPLKIVWTQRDPRHPQKRPDWMLYDLETDPLESIDLSSAHPEQRQKMLRLWTEFARQNGILDIDWDKFAP